MKKTSVLLIEDDLEFLRQLATAFERAGYRVHAATDGLIGLERFKANCPDLVITDILMPTREGLETIVEMKRARPDVGIIAMSGGGRILPYEFLHIAAHLGADRVIAKPFKLSDLLRLVEQILDPAHQPAHCAA
jgi:DNA-binding response OmpR family regulator